MIAAVVIVIGCGDGNTPIAADCTDGETRECYSGPAGTENVGPCKTGVEICSGGRWPGVCLGDVPPLVEQCNELDDNCNGVVDDVAGTNESCVGTNGCEGTRMCDDNGRVRCIAPAQNECDLCGGPEVPDVGDDCVANGCEGALVCTADARGSECSAPVQNECGVCGGPAVAGLTDACTSGDGCPGMMVCNVDGSAAECNAPMKNECDACFPSVGTVGATCSLAERGCIGATACSTMGDALECIADTPCTHIVISEVATDSSVCNTDEFIELYNPSTRTVSLAGYTLRSRSASSGNFTRLVTFAPDAAIGPHGFYLVANAQSSSTCPGSYTGIVANTVTADATYTSANLSSTVGGVWLTTVDQDPTAVTDTFVVDVVGWDNNPDAGDATVFEGSGPAAAHAADASASIERKASATSTATSMAAGGADVEAGNAHDTDDNAADFVVQDTRVPQNTSSTPEP